MAVLAFLMTVASIGLAEGAEIFVTTLDDELNSDGDCSLREAVQSANTDMRVDSCMAGESDAVDVIRLSGGTYLLTIRGVPEDANITGDIDVYGDVMIAGDPGGGTTLDGSVVSIGDQILDVLAGNVETHDVSFTGATPTFGGQSVLRIAEGSNLVMRRCTVTENNGMSGSFGILVEGGLKMYDSIISENLASSGTAVFCLAESVVELIRTEVIGNRAEYQGAAIDCSGGSFLGLYGSSITRNSTLFFGSGAAILTADHTVIKDSIIADNSTSQGGATMGGGVWVEDDWVAIDSSIIAGNSASPGAAILVGRPGIGNYGRSVVTLDNVIITDNDASQGIGGSISIFEDEAVVWLTSCTIAHNSGGLETVGAADMLVGATIVSDNQPSNCMLDPLSSLTSFGDNIEEGDTCGFDHSSDLVDVDPMLGFLDGGWMQSVTLMPLLGSPAIDSATVAPIPSLDIRGVPRPWDGNGDEEAVSDRGAVEYRPGVVFFDGFDVGDSWRWSAP